MEQRIYGFLALACQYAALSCVIKAENSSLLFLIVGLVSVAVARFTRTSVELNQLATTTLLYLLILFGIAKYLNVRDGKDGYFFFQLALPVFQVAVFYNAVRFSIFRLLFQRLRQNSKRYEVIAAIGLLLALLFVAFEVVPAPATLPLDFVGWLSYTLVKLHTLLCLAQVLVLATGLINTELNSPAPGR